MSDTETELHEGEFAIRAATRLGMRKSDWLPGWYVSWSPRNCNQNAEGTWPEWVELAKRIIAENDSLKAQGKIGGFQ